MRSSLRQFLLIATMVAVSATAPLTTAYAQTCEKLFRTPELERVGFADRVRSAANSSAQLVFEPFQMVSANARRRRDRNYARNLINGQRPPFPMPTWLGDFNLPLFWSRQNLQVPEKYGSVLAIWPRDVTTEMLKRHFVKTMGPDTGKIASDFIDELGHRDKVQMWATSVREEMNRAMDEDHVSSFVRYEFTVREFYLDKVLARRASEHGFQVTKEGLPFSVITFNALTFFQGTIGRGRLFVDWTGADLSAGNSLTAHYSRGHLLAMTYAAENVPNFINLIRTIGQTGDRDGAWQMLFDNAHSTSSPFWGGSWVHHLGPGLGIRY